MKLGMNFTSGVFSSKTLAHVYVINYNEWNESMSHELSVIKVNENNF